MDMFWNQRMQLCRNYSYINNLFAQIDLAVKAI